MTHLELTEKLLGLASWCGENMTDLEDAFAAIQKRQANCEHWVKGNWFTSINGGLNEFYADQLSAYCPKCGKQLSNRRTEEEK